MSPFSGEPGTNARMEREESRRRAEAKARKERENDPALMAAYLEKKKQELEDERKAQTIKRKFVIQRGSDDDELRMEAFDVDVEPGMVVLDAIHRIQSTEAPDLAVRWNCKAGKCGSCSVEINGKPRLACMTRMNEFDEDKTVIITPLKSFPVMRDMISCEEVFEADPQARSEFDAVCDEWLNESILAQDEEDTVDCTGCGEVWYRSAFPYAQGDTVDWCRKCYKRSYIST